MASAASLAKALVVRFDDAVDTRVDRIRGNPRIDRTMYAASELGDWSLIWHLIGAGQAMLPGRDPSSAVRLSAILGVASALFTVGFKRLFRRHRPGLEAARPRPHRPRTPRPHPSPPAPPPPPSDP